MCTKFCYFLILLFAGEFVYSQGIATESFDAAPQTLHLYSGGSGWFEPWYSQNAYTGPDGYSILNVDPMIHPEFTSPGAYAQGGGDNTASGRYFSPVSFADHLDMNGRIGVGNIYFSFLIRKEEDTDAPIEIILADSPNQAWQVNEELIKMGYFGTSSNVGADRYWSLSVFNETSVDLTDTLIEIGRTYQIIVEIAFASTTTINMWVNPEGGMPNLLLPDATVSSSEDLGFWNLVLYFEGAGTGHGSFDEFIFSSNLDVVLPVEYVTFYAMQQKNKTVIRWSTASELNNEYFEVQRSNDGSLWQTIGKVDGMGNSNSLNHYQFMDVLAQEKNVFYRLAQVDYDGKVNHSKVIQLSEDEHAILSVDVFLKEGLINVSSTSRILEILVYNLKGQLVTQHKPYLNSFHSSLPHVPPGIYQILVGTDRGYKTSKLFIRDYLR